MAKLFKNKIIKEKLEAFKVDNFEEKFEIVQRWHKDYHTGTLKTDKEISRAPGWTQDFLGEILGYIRKPSEAPTYDTEYTVAGQRPDFVLGHFHTGKNYIVGELKDAKTSLDAPQKREGSFTPIQQAFKYKGNLRDSSFVIVSNFFETRLYYDNYLDYEFWTLDTLVNPKDDYFELRKFVYLLSETNLITKKGESNTKGLISFIQSQQKEITKGFYKEYSLLRKELFKDIIVQAKKSGKTYKQSELDTILSKTQKIIDRIIFIHFCEDLDLLPNGKLKENLLRAEEIGFSPWEMLKKFFEFVNSGSERLGIPDGYNGGLFHKDEELEALIVGDEICKKFVDLGDYDFEDDLSVNILGHIFEQSISDIEELKDKIQKNEEVTLSKRKKDGVFYTPEYIVDYIVKNSVGKKIEDWEQELRGKHKLKEDINDKNYTKRAVLVYTELQEKLQNITVLDPACGSGAFLVKVFDFLLSKNEEINNQLIDLRGGAKQIELGQSNDYIKRLLQNNIYGVDLNEESVEITKLSLWLETASKGKKLANLDRNIKCGNSLIDDSALAGDKAFSWEDEFPQIFQDGGFDVIVGNPPYTYRNSISDEEKKYYEKSYKSVEGNSDLYKLFTEKGSSLIKKGGYYSFIIPNTFLSAKTYDKLRVIITEDFSILEIFDLGLGIFDDVLVESIIFLFKKTEENIQETCVMIQRDRKRDFFNYQFKYKLNLHDNFKSDGIFNINLTAERKSMFNKINNNSIPLKDICYSTVGINTGYIKNELTSSIKESDDYHKMLNGKNIGRYTVDWGGEWIKYDVNFVKSFGSKGRSLPPEYIFSDDKILIQRTRRGLKRKLVCYYDNEKYYNLNRLSNIVLTNKSFSLKYIYVLLNSELLDYYFNNSFNEYEVKPLHLSKLPIKNISLSEQTPFIEKADFMLKHNKLMGEKVQKFLKRVQGTFELEKLSKKVQKFYELDFADFVKELKKSKIVLSLKDQDEWEEYFESYKTDTVELKTKIDACDKEIDDMVFDLYGLSDEERSTIINT